MIGNVDILDYAKRTQTFTCKQMLSDFAKDGKSFSPNTITSALRRLVKNNILQKVDRGMFRLSQTVKIGFSAYYDEEMSMIESLVRTKFPFIRFCVWNSSDVKRFSHYVSNINVIFVDVERDCEKSVFNALINALPDKNIYLKPSQDDYVHYIFGKPTIVVRTLISEAPLILLGDKSTRVSLEKVLVDSVLDKDFFSFQEYESLRLFRNAYDVCSVNEQKLLRYARRRNKVNLIKNIITEVNNTNIFD
ncbi:hypothetical protein prwr041_21580 [Prevotella herbatica]|uniref:Transcriptional regulator n=1 Tax=Prevotella herbatica TaxID=2801997 RepID=A0ABM7P0G0_9BACT|nr:DUF6577 family protein [Prevotella herbatica]BCS86265.1 hypothetical protein prwr041_21580 [Prevotella herbatica]